MLILSFDNIYNHYCFHSFYCFFTYLVGLRVTLKRACSISLISYFCCTTNSCISTATISTIANIHSYNMSAMPEQLASISGE